MPQLPQSNKNVWTVKSTSQMNKPRFVFLVLQTNKQTLAAISDQFDHCNVTDVKLYLNSECYPYESVNTDFPGVNYQDLYYTFATIQSTYHNDQRAGTTYSYPYTSFANHPIFAFDCSRTDDSLVGGTVDIRLDITTSAAIPANTSAFCVIIYENEFEYSPFNSVVVKRT